MTSEGYVLVALGDTYKKMAAAFVDTLRLQGDERPVHIIDESNLKTNTELFSDCKIDFEKYGTYPKLTLDLHTPFDHTIYLDCDMLCGYKPDKVWDHFKSGSDVVKQMGLYPSLWAPEFRLNFEKDYNKKLYLCHGSMIYVRKSSEASSLFEFMRTEVWDNYYKYSYGDKTNKGLRYGRADQVIYSIASALNGIVPSDMLGYPFVTHVSTPNTFTGVPQKSLFFRNHRIEFEEEIPFFHMWSKIGTKTYNDVYESIVR